MDAFKSKRQKRISKGQEKRLAVIVGGKTIPASGAVRTDGGADVRAQGKLTLEAKYTEKGSYSLKLKDLQKVRAVALRNGAERSAFVVGFKGPRNIEEYAVVPLEEYTHLLETSVGYEDDEDEDEDGDEEEDEEATGFTLKSHTPTVLIF